MKKIVLYGLGGHCNSVIDVIESKKDYQIYKIFDDKIKKTNLRYLTEKSSRLKIEKIKNIHISFASIYDLKKREKVLIHCTATYVLKGNMMLLLTKDNKAICFKP